MSISPSGAASRRPLFFLAFLPLLAVLGVSAVQAASPAKTPGAADGLVLTASEPSHVAGSFTHGGTVVRFDASQEGSRRTLKLAAGSGRVLLEGSADATSFSISLFGGEVTISGPTPAAGALSQSSHPKPPSPDQTSGDRGALDRFVATPEYKSLPHLSRELGVQGITGRSHPVSLMLHELALASAYVHKTKVAPLAAPANRSTLDTPKASNAAGAVNAGVICADQTGDPCSDNCFGMCGAGCSCWSWVCGDCCINHGCLLHDIACSDWSCNGSSWAACFIPIVAVECEWQIFECRPETKCDCSALGSCGQIKKTDCGWCASTNTAMPGGKPGPEHGYCGNWIWDKDDCDCASIATCSGIAGKHCGWCADPASPTNLIGEAMPGSNKGPKIADNCKNWIWDAENCQCAGIKTCGGIAGSKCGWCSDLSQAMPGNEKGPKWGSCNNWIWYSSKCTG